MRGWKEGCPVKVPASFILVLSLAAILALSVSAHAQTISSSPPSLMASADSITTQRELDAPAGAQAFGLRALRALSMSSVLIRLELLG